MTIAQQVSSAPVRFVGAHATNSALSSPVGIALPENANGVWIQALSQNIRIRFDGGQPGASSGGFELRQGDPPVLIPLYPGAFFYVLQETASATIEYQFVNIGQ